MNKEKIFVITSWVLVVLLAILFSLASFGKLSGSASANFVAWGYPAWFSFVIGIAELIGAICLLVPKTTKLAIIGLTVIMVGAIFTHLANREGLQTVVPVIVVILLWIIWYLRKYSFSKLTTE